MACDGHRDGRPYCDFSCNKSDDLDSPSVLIVLDSRACLRFLKDVLEFDRGFPDGEIKRLTLLRLMLLKWT